MQTLQAALAAIHDLPLFIAAGLLLNLTPGVDMALIAARSLAGGARAGVAATLGVAAGCSLHTLAAALGISALLAGSPEAFAALRWVGAAYLVGLGLQQLFARAAAPSVAVTRPTAAAAQQAGSSAPAPALAPALAPELASTARIFWQGFLTNALNPKVALFFLAFVPQFIQPRASGQALAFVLLGLLFCFNAILFYLVLVALLMGLRRHVGLSDRLGRWAARACGAVFVALGVKLALAP